MQSSSPLLFGNLLKFQATNLYYFGVISALHSGTQCDSCGMRFKDIKCESYRHHLDWHFRMNQKGKINARNPFQRRWFYEIEDWIQFEEYDISEDRTPNFFELQAEINQESTEEPVPSVRAAKTGNEECAVCGESFQLFWVEDEEEWHLRNAVRHDDQAYHPACYEDYKKEIKSEELCKSESDATLDEERENSENDLKVNQEVIDLVDNLISQILEMESFVCETDENPLNCAVDIKEEVVSDDDTITPSMAFEIVEGLLHIKQEQEPDILEGKPGEEEIIGLISESDIESDHNLPTEDSQMVVMQSGGITLKVKAGSLQPSSMQEKENVDGVKVPGNIENVFRPPTPDPSFKVMPLVKKGKELSGLCTIM